MQHIINSDTLQWVYVSRNNVAFCPQCSWKIVGELTREEKAKDAFTDFRRCPTCESSCEVFIFPAFPEWIVKHEEEIYNVNSLGEVFRNSHANPWDFSGEDVAKFLEENCPKTADSMKWQRSVQNYREWRTRVKKQTSKYDNSPEKSLVKRVKKIREFEQTQASIDEAVTVKRKLKF